MPLSVPCQNELRHKRDTSNSALCFRSSIEIKRKEKKSYFAACHESHTRKKASLLRLAVSLRFPCVSDVFYRRPRSSVAVGSEGCVTYEYEPFFFHCLHHTSHNPPLASQWAEQYYSWPLVSEAPPRIFQQVLSAVELRGCFRSCFFQASPLLRGV